MTNKTKLRASIMVWGLLALAAGGFLGSGNSGLGLMAAVSSLPFGFYWGFNT